MIPFGTSRESFKIGWPNIYKELKTLFFGYRKIPLALQVIYSIYSTKSVGVEKVLPFMNLKGS